MSDFNQILTEIRKSIRRFFRVLGKQTLSSLDLTAWLADYQKSKGITRKNQSVEEDIKNFTLPEDIQPSQIFDLNEERLIQNLKLVKAVYSRCEDALDQIKPLDKNSTFLMFQNSTILSNQYKTNDFIDFICIIASGNEKVSRKVVENIIKKFEIYYITTDSLKKLSLPDKKSQNLNVGAEAFVKTLAEKILGFFDINHLDSFLKELEIQENPDLYPKNVLTEVVKKCSRNKKLLPKLLSGLLPAKKIALLVTDYFLVLQSHKLAPYFYNRRNFYLQNQIIRLLQREERFEEKNVKLALKERELIASFIFSNKQINPSNILNKSDSFNQKNFWKIFAPPYQVISAPLLEDQRKFLDSLSPRTIQEIVINLKEAFYFLDFVSDESDLSFKFPKHLARIATNNSLLSEMEEAVLDLVKSELIPKEFEKRVQPIIKKIEEKEKEAQRKFQEENHRIESYLAKRVDKRLIQRSPEAGKALESFEFFEDKPKEDSNPHELYSENYGVLFDNNLGLLKDFKLCLQHLIERAGKIYNLKGDKKDFYVKANKRDTGTYTEEYTFFIYLSPVPVDQRGQQGMNEFPYIALYQKKPSTNTGTGEKDKRMKQIKGDLLFYTPPKLKNKLYYRFLFDVMHVLNGEMWYSDQVQTYLRFLSTRA